MIYLAVDEPRRHLFEHYLARGWGEALAGRIRQVTYPELFRSGTMDRGAWIFTALEALSSAELAMAGMLQTAAIDAGLPVLNRASQLLRRHELLQTLHESGLNEFRAVRANEPLNGLRFPVFVRVADEHDGSMTPLLHDSRELRRALLYARLRGFPLEQLLVVEFCDVAADDGLYRKYSIFRIGERYIPRYLHIGAHWMVKEGTRNPDGELIREELAYLQQNPHIDWVRRVFGIAKIDYGRLDYGVRNGRPQAWEINVAPTLSGNPNRGQRGADHPLYRASSLAHTAIREAFAQLDPGTMEGNAVQVQFSPGLVAQAREERRNLETILKRRRWISKVAAAPGLVRVGGRLRRALTGAS